MDINKDLHVSTMTFISKTNTNVSLENLFDNMNINENIKYIEYGDKPTKGEKILKIKKPRKEKPKKYFYNQVTVHVFDGKIVNVKVFNNGKFQMTGIKYKQQGVNIVNMILDYIKNLSDENKEKIIDNLEPDIISSNIVMINTDFDCKFRINNEALHRIIINEGYYSSYEPSIYPGVNIKYYFNEMNPNCGICKCSDRCNGKGKNGNCKKITVAVFKSGCAIVTGGQTAEQINTAYDFIKNILNNRKKEITQ